MPKLVRITADDRISIFFPSLGQLTEYHLAEMIDDIAAHLPEYCGQYFDVNRPWRELSPAELFAVWHFLTGRGTIKGHNLTDFTEHVLTQRIYLRERLIDHLSVEYDDVELDSLTTDQLLQLLNLPGKCAGDRLEQTVVFEALFERANNRPVGLTVYPIIRAAHERILRTDISYEIITDNLTPPPGNNFAIPPARD